MNYTRRDFARIAIAAPLAVNALAARINSKINGVMVGSQSYSFRDLPLDGCIAGMKDIGLGYTELWQGHLEPKDKAALKTWRDNPPLDEIKGVRKKFDDAGIEIYAFNYSFRDDFTDAQIENGFKIAKALGTNRITASSNVSTSPRIDKFAEKYDTWVAMHNHDSMKANEFSTPDDFAAAMKGRSKYIKINLDIGHFTSANFDPVDFLEKHHDDIVTLHIKDRKKNHGPAVAFGTGDTNIKGVLQLLKAKKYPIPAMIEYEYNEKQKGLDTITEVRKCFDYVKSCLA
ncbi:MAG: sugar phosphate isomerase/epimerase [Acidobacteriota bacterium]|nr:sugar phosphate isomerase/epimerase [Acidobacteriota bacterium]